MNLGSHYDEAEMVHFEEIIAIYDDLVAANMNLISQIQEQIKKNIEGASLMILCMIGFGLNLLRTVRTTRNCIWFTLNNVVILFACDQKLSFNYFNEYGELDLLKMHIDQPWKNKLRNFCTLLGIM